jgi:Fur family transcriptional regulator, ferric uptake regulator
VTPQTDNEASATPAAAAPIAATAELHAVVESRLRRTDQRYTTGRRAIIELLVDARDPVSIGDIASRLPELPRSSAYRHLLDLQVAGVVRRIAANDEFARYELSEEFTDHHHHLLCTQCGKVTDVTPTPAFERNVASTIGDLADAEGFQPRSHRLDILGLCRDCR